MFLETGIFFIICATVLLAVVWKSMNSPANIFYTIWAGLYLILGIYFSVKGSINITKDKTMEYLIEQNVVDIKISEETSEKEYVLVDSSFIKLFNYLNRR